MTAFAPSIERWRSTVAKYVEPAYVDKFLWAMNYESGGDPNAAGDNGVAIGLMQIQNDHAFLGRPTTAALLDPEYNIAYAANELGAGKGNFSAWGDGVLYHGQPFGAFGNHPYPGDIAPIGSSTPGAITAGLPGLPGLPPIPFVPSPGDIIDGLGNAIDILPGGHYVTDAAGNVRDAAGNIIGKLSDAAKDKIPGFAIAARLLEVLKGAGAAFSWLLDPHNWFKLFFVAAGSAMVAIGAYIYVRGDRVIGDAQNAGALAAKIGAA